MKSILYFLIIAVGCAACACNNPDPDNPPIDDILPGEYTNVSIKSTVDAVQPSTGLVLWSDNARSRNSKYGESISLEYAYCLPCKVVKGKVDGKL